MSEAATGIQINIPALRPAHLRWGSGGLYLLIFIAFFFTFIDIKCGETSLIALKGTDLVVGKKMEGGSTALMKDHDHFGKPLWPALLAFLSAIAGAVLMFIKGRKGRVLQIAISALGALSIALIKIVIDYRLGTMSDTPSGLAQGLIQVVYAPAYWLSLLLFVLNICYNILLLFIREKVPEKPVIPEERMSWEQDAEV
jgi:hypothetical protein